MRASWTAPVSRKTVRRAWCTPFPTVLNSWKRSRFRRAVAKSPGRESRLSAVSRLYVSTLRRNQAAFAPNFPLGSARSQLVLEHVMGVLDRAGLLPVPLEEGQAVARPVRDDGEVLDRPALGEELALALGDPEGQLPAHAGAGLPVVAVLRYIGHLGPLASGLGVLLLELPGGGRQALDLGLELLGHIGADGILDFLILAPAEDVRLVQRDVPRSRIWVTPAGSCATARSSRRRFPQPAGTWPSRNSSWTITSCSAQSTTTGW